jgi:hypothetical protein
MAGFSDFLENEILDHIFNGSAYASPAKYVALFTAAPSDAGGGTEVSGNGYARELHSAWAVASGGSTSNTGAVTFDNPSGSWGTVSHFGIFDSLTGGNLLAWGSVGTSKPITTGDVASFASGALTITLD